MRLLIFGLVILFSTVSAADTWTVDDDNKADFDNIQDAVNVASDGDAVHISPGTYTETINMLGKAIQLVGIEGPDVTIVDATGLDSSVIVCSNNESAKTVISGLTITGGTGTVHPDWLTLQGGGIFVYHASPTVENCIITGNQAEFAGGMWAQEFVSSIENVQFSNNQATYPETGGGGALYLWNSTALVTGCEFENNSSVGPGGGVRCKTSPTGGGGDSIFRNCTYTQNQSPTWGGAVAVFRASPTFEFCVFNNNDATDFAGAVSVGVGQTSLISCTFTNNTTGFVGGAVRINEASAVVEKCSFISNSAPNGGGGIAVAGGSSSATCTISGSTFQNNDSDGWGSAISHIDIATSDIDSTMFCGNPPPPISGSWNDLGGNTMNSSCTYLCMGDIDASGEVAVSDILTLIADFGQCNGIDSCFSDLNDDEQVNVSDLLILISNWGGCQ